MKFTKVFFLLINFYAINFFCQENWLYEKNPSEYKKYFKDTFGINITFPKTFKNLDLYTTVFKVSKDPDKHIGSSFFTLFISKDKNCMISYPFSLFGFNFHPSIEKKMVINEFYFRPKSQVINEVRTSLGLYYNSFSEKNNNRVNFDIYKYADFIFGRQAREKYNADAYSISHIPNSKDFEFSSKSIDKLPKNKFPYCTSLFIQKDNIGAFEIKFFFTEKGFKKKEKYIKMLDKHIWFDENFKPKKEE